MHLSEAGVQGGMSREHDDEMRQKCIDFNPGEATVGSGVTSEFRTDGSATATLALLYTDHLDQQQYQHIQTKVTLCTDLRSFSDHFPRKRQNIHDN